MKLKQQLIKLGSDQPALRPHLRKILAHLDDEMGWRSFYSLFMMGRRTAAAESTAALLRTALDWCDRNDLCRGNLGIPRKLMPQIPSNHMPDFVSWLREQGIRVEKTARKVRDLRATQNEIKPEKVDKLLKAPHSVLVKKPVLTAKDNHIADGHHRWAALLTKDPDAKMPIYLVDLSIRDLLSIAKDYKNTHFETLDESRA